MGFHSAFKGLNGMPPPRRRIEGMKVSSCNSSTASDGHDSYDPQRYQLPGNETG